MSDRRRGGNGHASLIGSQCRWADAGTDRRQHAERRALGGARRHAPVTHRDAGRHLLGASDVPHRSAAQRSRRRCQRLAVPRTLRDMAVAAVEPPARRRARVGRGQEAGSGLHLRQHVLVVQHGVERGLRGDAAADIQSRRAQIARLLHAALRAARQADRQARRLPAVLLLGAGNVDLVHALDCGRGAARHGDVQSDANPRLSPTP